MTASSLSGRWDPVVDPVFNRREPSYGVIGPAADRADVVTYQAPSDREPLAAAILRRVAATAEVDPLVLPALYDVIDPDALDALVASMADGEVSFAYSGWRVSVDSQGGITVSGEASST